MDTLLFFALAACSDPASPELPQGSPSGANTDSISPSGEATAVDVGGCYDSAAGPELDSTWEGPTTDMVAESSGHEVVLHVTRLEANCCPSPAAGYVVEGEKLRVDFEDVSLESACGCMCTQDFDITLLDVPNGSYIVDLYVNTEYTRSTTVTVAG